MYAARVGDQDLTFVVSGMLWQRSLVMQDQQTGSLWSHLLGRAMRGRLEGQELEMLPSLMTDWKTWRDQHPETTVLNMSRTARQFQRDVYRDPSQYVIGLSALGQAKAWRFDQLLRQPVVNDQFRDTPVLVVMIPDSHTATVYDRTVEGRELTFANIGGRLVDDQTETQWNPATGEAVAGPLAGRQLRPKVGIVSYRRAWRDFYPNSEYWQAQP